MPSWRIKRWAISCCSLRKSVVASRAGPESEDDIFPHRGGGDDAIGFPVFRAEADTQYRSLMWRSQGLLFAFDQRRAAVSWFDTEDHFGGFGTS